MQSATYAYCIRDLDLGDLGNWVLIFVFKFFFNIPGPDSGFLGLRPEPRLEMSGFENFAPYHFSYKTPFRINLHLKTK